MSQNETKVEVTDFTSNNLPGIQKDNSNYFVLAARNYELRKDDEIRPGKGYDNSESGTGDNHNVRKYLKITQDIDGDSKTGLPATSELIINSENSSIGVLSSAASGSGSEIFGIGSDLDKEDDWDKLDNNGEENLNNEIEPYIEEPNRDLEFGPGSIPSVREQWSNKWEFLLSCISLSVGLGNVWRFPFIAFANGGGAFLIPYFIVVLLIGRPIYFMELCLGQFSSLSSIQVWRINPFFAGIGWASMIATMLVLSYYCTVISLSVFYFIQSFQNHLPWDNCDPQWAKSLLFSNISCFINSKGESKVNITLTNVSTAELYFTIDVLKERVDINTDPLGTPEWRLTLCLLFSWCVVFFSLIKGVQSSGKVAYFTALFPYVVLLILLFRAVTLDGAGQGVLFLFKPNFTKLKEPIVWYNAVTQCFYSLNTGFGSIIMLSSYNPIHQNLYRDSLVISFMDTFTSLLAGVTIFAVLGSLAKQSGLEISDVAKSGSGLAFIAYPNALAEFGVAKQFFSIIFFLMLFTLGIGSVTADAAAIITIICDFFPSFQKWIVTAVLCVSTFLFGLTYVTPGGQSVLELVDFFGGSFIIFVTSTLEVIAVIWIYGEDRFIRDIEFMMNRRVGLYWRLCWGKIAPIGLCIIILYYFLVDYSEIQYRGQEYPGVAIVFGWLIVASALACLPICAFYAVLQSKKTTWREKFNDALVNSEDWGPRDPVDRQAYNEFVDQHGLYTIDGIRY